MFEQFQDMSIAFIDFIIVSKPDRHAVLHQALAARNTAGFIGRGIKYYLTKHVHVILKKGIQLSPKSCALSIVQGPSPAVFSIFISLHISLNVIHAWGCL